MVSRVQTLRSSLAGARPTGQAPGQLYTNWPDKQLGVADSSGNPLDLIAVRYFSATSSYQAGDAVLQGGALWTANAAVPAGAWNPSQWTASATAAALTSETNARVAADAVTLAGAATYADTKLALVGGILTGPLTLAANPTANLGASTKQYTDAGDAATLTAAEAYALSAASGAGGFINKLRNGTFDVWQRGTVSATAGGGLYTADGWIVNPTGAAVSVARVVLGAGAPLNTGASALNIAGAAGVTGFTVAQRIESYVAAALAGQTCTVQFWILSPIAQTPQIRIAYAGSLDVWTAPVDVVSPTNLQLLPAGNVWTRVAYTFAMPMNAQNGVLAQLVFGALTSGSLNVAAADLRATPGVPVGLNANPPPPELRPIATETLFCQRYYQTRGNHNVGGVAANGVGIVWGNSFSGFMRTAPTVVVSMAGGSGYTQGTPSQISNSGFSSNATGTATAYTLQTNWTASAEL